MRQHQIMDRLIRRFHATAGGVCPDGYILQGSLVRRRLVRETAEGSKVYGPYYLWTRKVRGTTVTRALDAQTANVVRDAIRRYRELVRRLEQTRVLSERIILFFGSGVPKRKRGAQNR